ncbi:phage virion morphogenesis protein, partial [Arthrospira platensis SPKY1]|nr:phage virion morphogenesis protein [Arthrospira platensis SPKY1]
LGMLRSKDLRKDGRVSKTAAPRLATKKPLVASGLLAEQIRWQLLPGGGVAIGTNRFAGAWPGGAAVHQFGSRDGRIPARPFLGLSSADRSAIDRIVRTHLQRALGA